MSVYRDLNSAWEKEWLHVGRNVKSEKGKSYLDKKDEFLNSKLSDLERDNPGDFSQYCSDFVSVQDSKRKTWSIAAATTLALGAGLVGAAALGVMAITPVFLGAVATVAVAHVISVVKHRRYKMAFNLAKVLRGDKPQMKYFKLFRKDKEQKHFVTMDRNEFVNSEDYHKILKASKIPPAVEKRFDEIYGYSQDLPKFNAEDSKDSSKEVVYYPDEIIPPNENYKTEPVKSKFNTATLKATVVSVLKQAVIAYIRNAASSKDGMTKWNSEQICSVFLLKNAKNNKFYVIIKDKE